MDQEKPFKTIEVIDSRTQQICKVACMSCIRGHRTTSCGIPVCRNKIFWTVKRPGRPSNSCTCRYGASGRCKCVVARPACPHKAKKGEKRSGECRCDEQGRFCCLIDPEHWIQLLALQKPTVDFFPTREALEAKQMAVASLPFPQTPTYSTGSPATFHSQPGTPTSLIPIPPIQSMPSSYSALRSPQSSTLTPRFGMMGIGGPQGSESRAPPDVLAWEGQAPQAPEPFHEQRYQFQEEQPCCQGPASTSSHPPRLQHVEAGASSHHTSVAPMGGILQDVSMVPSQTLSEPAFDFDKMMANYLNYQFPSAICQSCGISGCTCKNCPAVMQNFNNGSWAQCCGRKHARQVASVAQPGPSAPITPHTSAADIIHQPSVPEAHHASQPVHGDIPMSPLGTAPDFDEFDLDRDFSIPDGSEHMDLTDLLLSELDVPHGLEAAQNDCCHCGDP